MSSNAILSATPAPRKAIAGPLQACPPPPRKASPHNSSAHSMPGPVNRAILMPIGRGGAGSLRTVTSTISRTRQSGCTGSRWLRTRLLSGHGQNSKHPALPLPACSLRFHRAGCVVASLTKAGCGHDRACYREGVGMVALKAANNIYDKWSGGDDTQVIGTAAHACTRAHWPCLSGGSSPALSGPGCSAVSYESACVCTLCQAEHPFFWIGLGVAPPVRSPLSPPHTHTLSSLRSSSPPRSIPLPPPSALHLRGHRVLGHDHYGYHGG